MTTIKGVEDEIPVAFGMQQVPTPPAQCSSTACSQQATTHIRSHARHYYLPLPAFGEPLELGVVKSSALRLSEIGESLPGDSGTWLNVPVSPDSVSLPALVSNSSSPSSELFCSMNSLSSCMSLFLGTRSLEDLDERCPRVHLILKNN